MGTVANFDVATIADYCVAFARELVKSQSSRLAQFTPRDRERATSYLERIKAYVELVATELLDLPQSHPGGQQIADFPPDADIDGIENAVVKGVLRRFKASYVEIIGSQSKDQAAGLHAADAKRLEELLDATIKLVNFGADTLDLPENTGPLVIETKK